MTLKMCAVEPVRLSGVVRTLSFIKYGSVRVTVAVETQDFTALNVHAHRQLALARLFLAPSFQDAL
jgi:hypothetical protein